MRAATLLLALLFAAATSAASHNGTNTSRKERHEAKVAAKAAKHEAKIEKVSTPRGGKKESVVPVSDEVAKRQQALGVSSGGGGPASAKTEMGVGVKERMAQNERAQAKAASPKPSTASMIGGPVKSGIAERQKALGVDTGTGGPESAKGVSVAERKKQQEKTEK